MKAQFFKTKLRGEEMLGEVLLDEQGRAYASTNQLARLLENWTIFEAGDNPKPVSMTDGTNYIKALAKTPNNGYFFVVLVKEPDGEGEKDA